MRRRFPVIRFIARAAYHHLFFIGCADGLSTRRRPRLFCLSKSTSPWKENHGAPEKVPMVPKGHKKGRKKSLQEASTCPVTSPDRRGEPSSSSSTRRSPIEKRQRSRQFTAHSRWRRIARRTLPPSSFPCSYFIPPYAALTVSRGISTISSHAVVSILSPPP